MKIKNTFLLMCALCVCMLSLMSCDGKRVEQAQNIIINEVMTSNRTGVLTDKGKASDWIELKNASEDSINLKGFQLAVVKPNGKKTEDGKTEDKVTTWKFPKVYIGAGQCMLIFAEKDKTAKKKKDGEADESEAEEIEEEEKEETGSKDPVPGAPLVADLKLPKEGGIIQFRAPNGDVIKEVKYGPMAPDQALVLRSDSTYAPSYMATPGFENNRKGYEAASIKMQDQRKNPLQIWELMSRAQHSGENWVELKNTGSTPLSLKGYRLSKKMGKNQEGWNLPDKTLQPGEIVTVQLRGSDANQSNGMQATFKIGSGETIILSKDGKFVDGVCAKSTPMGGSIGRANGRKGFFYYASPSRNAENGDAGRRFITESPEFNIKPGLYPKEKQLTLRLKNKDQKVHYTTNGSEPTFDSPLLKDSLVITKGTVIRTLAEGDSTALRSPVTTATYLVGIQHNLPVINVSLNSADMYDPTNGIYVKGPGYTEEWPHKGANYWQRWTKKAHVEFFDNKPGKDGFSTDCGFKIFGGFSRAEDKKSFRLKFRGQYGNKDIEYDFFDNGKPVELKDLVLRSGSQDWNRCMVRDEFFTSLMKAQCPELLIQEYRPVALYINAEYFGLYFIREKIDKNFVQRKLKLPTNDSINIIMSKYNELGSKKAYDDMTAYIRNNDMTNNANYDYVAKNVDLQGLIDYKLGEIFSGNSDVGNIRYVRSTGPGSDKKWHFVFYDLDASWAGTDQSTPSFYLSAGADAAAKNVLDHNIWIGRLLTNKNFRELFLQRLSHHMKNTFSPKNTTAVFDKLVAQIRPEMKVNCQRWPQLGYQTWEKNIDTFRSKFETRPKIVLTALKEYLNVTDAENKKYFAGL